MQISIRTITSRFPDTLKVPAVVLTQGDKEIVLEVCGDKREAAKFAQDLTTLIAMNTAEKVDRVGF